MEKTDIEISNILKTAINKAKIIGHFQYGHNLLQSPVQIDEIFSMLDTIINEVVDVVDDVIPDINLAPYRDGFVDSNRANLCWIELEENYYGLILNTQKGIKYRQFSDEEIQNLLLNGQISSWYLVSKIQNLSYLLAKDVANEDSSVEYFKQLIVDIIERFFYEHENSDEYHPAGIVNKNKIESIFSKLQIQNANSIVPASTIEDHTGDATWSQSLIKTQTHEICWQSAPDFKLKPMTPALALNILSSKYFNSRSDVSVFLKETFLKYKGNAKSEPNEFCFIARDNLGVSYIDLNYIVECQLRGYIEVEYTNGEIEKIIPDTQPFVIEKGKNDISFMVVIKLNNDLTKKVKRIITAKPNNSNDYLPSMRLVCSCTGISEIISN